MGVEAELAPEDDVIGCPPLLARIRPSGAVWFLENLGPPSRFQRSCELVALRLRTPIFTPYLVSEKADKLLAPTFPIINPFRRIV